MRGIATLLPAKYKFKQIFPARESWGIVATSTPRKQREDSCENGERVRPFYNEKTDPIVAFSKPPPMPPILGPLVALSLLETWMSRDGKDD